MMSRGRALAPILLTFGLLATSRADAAPPAPGSEQAIAMAPYAETIRNMRAPSGELCCDMSDCREVDYRIKRGEDGMEHYEALIRREDFSYAPFERAWLEVPDSRVVQPGKRLPITLACWTRHGSDNGFWCFSPGAQG